MIFLTQRGCHSHHFSHHTTSSHNPHSTQCNMSHTYIRDHALRAVYGNWDFLKNKSEKKDQFAKKKLAWVAYIGGKRESRRLMGDLVLREQDILNDIQYEDATFTTTWGVDLHYPKPIQGMKEEPFLSYCDVQEIKPYAVPYGIIFYSH